MVCHLQAELDFIHHAALQTASVKRSNIERGIFTTSDWRLDIEKWQLLQTQRLTIAIASEKVGCSLVYQAACRTAVVSLLSTCHRVAVNSPPVTAA